MFTKPGRQATRQFQRSANVRGMHHPVRGFPLIYPQDEAFNQGGETALVDLVIDMLDKTHQWAASRGKHV